MIDPQRIAAAFGGEAHGNQVLFPTPGHSPRDRGVSVTIDPAAPDGFLVHVHNGGDPLAIKRDIIERCGLSRESATSGWRVTGTYVYTDENGDPLYRTRRKERPAEAKKFDAQRYDAGTWANGLKDTRRVPYRLVDLLMTEESEPILFAEGERKADKLAEMGFVATAIAFGCKGWRGDYAEHFRGRTVVILPDNDEPGLAFAETVKRAIEGAGERAIILELPGLPPKGDVMDWNGSAAELRELVEAQLERREAPSLLPLIVMETWRGRRPPLREFAWGDWMPLRQTTMLTGDGGVGKSLLAQMLCTAAALGLDFLGKSMRQTPALYLTCEDDESELWRRQEAICAAFGVPLERAIGGLHFVSLAGQSDTALAVFDANGRLSATDRWRQVEATAAALSIGFAAFDTATDVMAGDHSSLHEVAEFVQLLTGLAIRQNGVSLILHHPNKAGDDWLGSIAWHNKVRSRLIMKASDVDGDPDARSISNPKANYARANARIDFRWFKGAFVRDDDLPANLAAEMAANAAANADNDAFLACLRLRNEQRRPVSATPCPNYAPTQFEQMPEAKRIGKRRLVAAMDRLFRAGTIETGFLWRDTAKGRDIYGLRELPQTLPQTAPQTLSPNVPERQPQTSPNILPSTTYIEGAACGAATPSDDNEGAE